MPKSDAPEIGPNTAIKLRLGVLVSIITFIVGVVGGGYTFHEWMSNRFQQQEEKLDTIQLGNSNILFAVKKCWSIEDQQNWRDEEIELNPSHKLPKPNEVVRKRLLSMWPAVKERTPQ